jgi:hypothetical protein
VGSLTGTVVDVEFTRGSPFGEQWWTFDINGEKKKKYAMWLNFNSPDRWPRRGETVDINELGERKCSTGGGGYIICAPCADLVKIHREVAVSA